MKNKKLITLSIIAIFGLFAGGCSNFQADKPIDIGHPKKGDFVIVGDMSVPRYNHQTILLDDGTVFIKGGTETAEPPEVYNPKTKKFKSVGQLIKMGGFFNPVKLQDGKILLSGGRSLKSTQMYNPKTEKFEKGTNMNFYRENHTATLLNDGRVLISGGACVTHPLINKKIPDELYNPKTNKFELGPKLNIPRRYHSAILLNDGRVLVIGGVGKRGFLSEAEIYNPKTNKFKLIGKINTPKMEPNLYLLKNGNVLISGGIKDQDNGKGMDSIYAREIELYNPKTNTFKIIAKRSSEPNAPAEVLLSDDKLLFTGSQTGVGLSLRWYASSEIFDPKTKKFTQGKNMNYTRSCHRMTLLKDGNVLVTGSYSKNRTAELYIAK